MKKRVHVEVSGLVQGVFFRESTRRRAEARGVTGWVRNRADGSVEAVFEGEGADVDAVVVWCERGPLGAEVESVHDFEEPYRGEFDRFAVVG
jgi:acylphosphatase